MQLTAYLMRRTQKIREFKVGLLSVFYGNVSIDDLVNPFLTNVLILKTRKHERTKHFLEV